MKKLVSVTFILAFVLFVAPNQSYAAWWDFPSWFSKNQQQPQNATSSDMASESQIVNQDVEKVEQKNALAPSNNAKSSDAKTIEELRAEVATLKINLDNLENRFNNLQKNTAIQPTSGGTDVSQRIATLERKSDALTNLILDGDTSRIFKLEQRVNALSSISTSVGSNNTVDRKLSDLESTLDKLCSWTIGSSVLSGCPLFGPTFSIDQRLEKLERGY